LLAEQKERGVNDNKRGVYMPDTERIFTSIILAVAAEVTHPSLFSYGAEPSWPSLVGCCYGGFCGQPKL
jgi:hypothetical protein